MKAKPASGFGHWALALLLVQGSVPSAQQTKPPVFTSRVDLVTLDVSVLDKDHRPVRGLTAADFVVKEDGKPQQVMALHEVDLDDAPPPPVAWMRDVTPDVTTNTIEESRLVIIVIDDAMIPMDPRITKDTKKIVADVINKLHPTDYTAIVFTADSRQPQDFTHDRATLLAAAERFTGGIASYTFGYESANAGGPQVDPDSHYYEGAIRTLSNVADYLIASSSRRKALIWVSPGVPVGIEGNTPMKAPDISAGGADAAHMSDHEILGRLMDQTRDLMRRAQRANVVVYPIDPTGLGGLEAYIFSHLPGSMQGAFDPQFGSAARRVAHTKATASYDFVETAAANTGGHAIVNTNDFTAGIDQIFRENSSYYLLGFQPLNTKDDGTLRRIDVQVTRPGLEVRTRSGYYAPKAEDGKPNPKVSPENAALAKAIGGLLPATDLPMGVTVAPFAVRDKRNVAVTIALGVTQPVPAAAATTKITESTELQISAFTPDGQPRGTERQTAHVQLKQGATGEAQYEVLGRIDLAPGRYALRLAAHNATSKKTGSVSIPVAVPDFANEPFSASGVSVSRSPMKAYAPKDLLSSLIPIVPTSDREFAASDKAEAFLRLYQSGKKSIGDATLVIRIANDRGRTDVNETRTIGIEEFKAPEASTEQIQPGVAPTAPRGRGVPPPTADKPDPFANTWLRTADVRYPIPLSTLKPGQYLLTFEATVGATTIRRDVRFAVK